MITVEGLKAMPVDEPIGEAVICDIECMANEGLQPFYQREFEPYEGVYRVNDFAKYVSEDSWRKFWSAFPEWCEQVFMLYDNTRSDDYCEFTSEVLSGLTPIEIGEQFEKSREYDLDYVFWTQADDEGHV